MKVSEFKEIIIRNYGSKEWENMKNSYEYKIYSSNEEEQLTIIKQNPYAIKFISNPTEEMQLEAIKQDDINILNINNPTYKVIEQTMKNMNDDNRFVKFVYLLRYIENDLKGYE